MEAMTKYPSEKKIFAQRETSGITRKRGIERECENSTVCVADNSGLRIQSERAAEAEMEQKAVPELLQSRRCDYVYSGCLQPATQVFRFSSSIWKRGAGRADAVAIR